MSKSKTDMAWEYTSPLGTKLQLARLKSGKKATREYLKASFGNGSYPSSAGNPLFAVQIGLIPMFGDTAAPGPVTREFALCVTQWLTQTTLNNVKALQPNPPPGVKFADPQAIKADNYATFNLSQDQVSPATQNDTTSQTVSWGISIDTSIAADPSGTLGGDFSKSESRDISDLQVYDQIWNTPLQDKTLGTIWQMVFTQKNGMNRSSFQPRCDVLASAPPDALGSGRFNYLLVEKLIYWGPWSDRLLDAGTGAAVGAGVGLAASILFAAFTFGLGAFAIPIAAAAGAAGGGIGNKAHNDLLDAVLNGDEMQLYTMWDQASAAGKASSHATLLSLDLANDVLTPLSTWPAT